MKIYHKLAKEKALNLRAYSTETIYQTVVGCKVWSAKSNKTTTVMLELIEKLPGCISNTEQSEEYFNSMHDR